MTTFRVDSQDFREFISWLIKEGEIQDNWSFISQVYEKPWHWYDEYIRFQEETYVEEGDAVIRKAFEQDRTLRLMSKKELEELSEMGTLVHEIQALYAKGEAELEAAAVEDEDEEFAAGELEEVDLAELGQQKKDEEEGWGDR